MANLLIYNNASNCSISKKTSDAGYSDLNVKKIFVIVSMLKTTPVTYKNKDSIRETIRSFDEKKVLLSKL